MAEESIGLIEGNAEEPTESTGPDFGTDLLEDVGQPDASSEGAGPSTPNAATTADSAVDLTTADPDTLPDHLRPAAEYVKRLQADYTRKTMDLADQRRAVENMQGESRGERQQYIQALSQAPGAQQQDDPIQALYDALPEEDRRGLNTVDQLVDHRIRAALGEGTLEQISSIRSELDTLKSTQNSGRVREIQSELAEARAEYGDLVDQYSDLLVNNYGRINPNTNQNFTVSEILGLFSGRTAEAAQSARSEDQRARSASKRRAAPRAQSAAAGTNGDLSDAEASDLISQLDGFTT